MDPQTRTELDELSLAILRQDARLAALQLTMIEMARLEGEQLEAFLDRLAVHHGLQLRALAERVAVRHPAMGPRLRGNDGSSW
jgi:hypothetical protein